jgi:hypothetical protein
MSVFSWPLTWRYATTSYCRKERGMGQETQWAGAVKLGPCLQRIMQLQACWAQPGQPTRPS